MANTSLNEKQKASITNLLKEREKVELAMQFYIQSTKDQNDLDESYNLDIQKMEFVKSEEKPEDKPAEA